MGSEKEASFQEAEMGIERMWATAGLAKRFQVVVLFLPFFYI